MPKIKCTFEFFESELISKFGYLLSNPVNIGNRIYVCDLQGPNLEKYSDDDLVIVGFFQKENNCIIKKTGKCRT